MKKTAALMAVLAVLSIPIATPVVAQPMMHWRGSGGWGPMHRYNQLYDPAEVETIGGEIERVETITPFEGMAGGIHLILKAKAGPLDVHLGPRWYIENQDIKLAPGDRVEVRGARTMFAGEAAVIAAEVKKGNDVLTLRDTNGFPVWSGWRQRTAVGRSCW